MNALLPALLTGALLTGSAEAAQVRHAVVVGANLGGGVLEPLRYAERDAEQVGELLVELGDFDDSLVTVLYAPTPDDLRAALAEHAAVAEQYEDDLFLFYYSGHADAQGLRLDADRYFYETLQHDVRAIDSEIRLGILDACRSGAITRLKGASVGSTIFTEDGAAEGEAWLTASSADELAQESDALRGGFFTHYLMSGMRGAADANDGVVDLEELKNYTTDRVIAHTSATEAGTQHPNFVYKLSGWGKVAITDLSRASARIHIPQSVEGHLSVLRLPDKVQIAEAAKADGERMSLALPPGRYKVLRRDEHKLYEVGFQVNEGTEFEVLNWGAARLDETTARGDRIEEYLQLSEAYEERLGLGSSPVVAGGASMVIPGAGQLYNRQFAKGAAYLAATAGLVSMAFAPGEQIDPSVGPLLGLALWGASVADAAYQVHRYEKERPRRGATLSVGGAFGGAAWPRHYGLSADLMVGHGFSFGLDRVGYTPIGDGYDLAVGSRMMMAFVEGQRWRPAGFVAMGYRHGQAPGTSVRLSRVVFGVGANMRYYVVPRYFTEIEARYEQSGEHSGLVTAVMFGTHLGR